MNMKNIIVIDGTGIGSKADVFSKVADSLKLVVNQIDTDLVVKGLVAREEISSTGFDDGFAIPHTKVSNMDESYIVVVNNLEIEWPSIDGKKTNVAIAILVPEVSDNEHLSILSNLSRNLVHQDFKDKIKTSHGDDVANLILSSFESEDNNNNNNNNNNNAKVNVVAVTACTTGIAHTFMAAENIEVKARELGFNIKVETRGQGGVQDELSSDDIKNADYIIVATDIQTPMSRFNGKKVLKRKVKAGVDHPELLFTEMLDAEVLNVSSEDNESSDKVTPYKALMNGVTHMLPFTIAGGILIALRFFFGTAGDLEAGLVPVIENLPLGEFFGSTGGVLFAMMLPVLAAYIAYAIGNRAALMPGALAGILATSNGSGFLGAIVGGFLAGYAAKYLFTLLPKLPKSIQGSYQILFMPVLLGIFIGLFMLVFGYPIAFINTSMTNGLTALENFNPLLLGALVGAMMATDMGGPINKAAYVTGTLLLAEGNQTFMAAVMAGGMVPPLAIALSCLLHKNLYNKDQLEAGKTNWILGLSFITEGAIPFAAADPKRVIPALMIGSATAGALTMLFRITLPAPHGGIFVFPLVNSPLLYLIAIIAGTVVGAIFLSIFKKGIK